MSFHHNCVITLTLYQPAETAPSPVPTPQPSTPKLSFARRDSFLSNGGSENFTIEGRVERRERAERQRQAETQQNPLLVTRTGNRLRKSTSRAPSISSGFSDSRSTISTVSSVSNRAPSSSRVSTPRLPQVTEEKTPAPSIVSLLEPSSIEMATNRHFSLVFREHLLQNTLGMTGTSRP
jgi:hypothetical protein